jgi:hypothetical protein
MAILSLDEHCGVYEAVDGLAGSGGGAEIVAGRPMKPCPDERHMRGFFANAQNDKQMGGRGLEREKKQIPPLRCGMTNKGAATTTEEADSLRE